MPETLYVRPAPSRAVFREDGSAVIPPEGGTVPLTTYYRRRLRDGDLLESDPPEPEEEALLAAIARVGEDPDGATQDGRPKVEALEAILGRHVTAAARDRAWTAYQAQSAATADYTGEE